MTFERSLEGGRPVDAVYVRDAGRETLDCGARVVVVLGVVVVVEGYGELG